MANDKVIHVSDGDFDAKVMQSNKPFLLDFWAPWCGPCKAIGPVVNELAADYDGRAFVGKMNVDDSPVTPGKYDIRAIPTLILFKNGKEVDRVTGAVGKAKLASMIDAALA